MNQHQIDLRTDAAAGGHVKGKGWQDLRERKEKARLCHPYSATLLDYWLCQSLYEYFLTNLSITTPRFKELMGTFNWLGLVTLYVCCLGVGEGISAPALSFCDGKCGMDLTYIGFFMIKEGCLCPEQPQVIIIQFILLLWFFIQFT